MDKPTEDALKQFKISSAQWAVDALTDPNSVIIDIESTGLLRENPDTEIVQLCIINMAGRELFSMLLKPMQPMDEKVIEIHKITNEEIINQPVFPQVAKMIAYVLRNKHVISWNMDFDWKLLMHMFTKYNEAKPQIAKASCAMDRYSEWAGEWSVKKGGFKWQKLPNFSGEAAHDAFTDCKNTLMAIQKMSGQHDFSRVSEEEIDLDF